MTDPDPGDAVKKGLASSSAAWNAKNSGFAAAWPGEMPDAGKKVGRSESAGKEVELPGEVTPPARAEEETIADRMAKRRRR